MAAEQIVASAEPLPAGSVQQKHGYTVAETYKSKGADQSAAEALHTRRKQEDSLWTRFAYEKKQAGDCWWLPVPAKPSTRSLDGLKQKRQLIWKIVGSH